MTVQAKFYSACVFIDAPCSGTGTWRRKPDTKWRLTEKSFAKRQDEQAEILRESAKYVKPGGRILYATCSFLMEEDEDQVASFLADVPGFAQDSAADAAIASGLLTDEGAQIVNANQGQMGSVRLTPKRAGTDGFFFAVLRRA